MRRPNQQQQQPTSRTPHPASPHQGQCLRRPRGRPPPGCSQSCVPLPGSAQSHTPPPPRWCLWHWRPWWHATCCALQRGTGGQTGVPHTACSRGQGWSAGAAPPRQLRHASARRSTSQPLWNTCSSPPAARLPSCAGAVQRAAGWRGKLCSRGGQLARGGASAPAEGQPSQSRQHALARASVPITHLPPPTKSLGARSLTRPARS